MGTIYMKRAVITGPTGSIGIALINELEANGAILGGVFGVLKLILAPRSGDVGKGAFHRYQILSPGIGHEK